MKALTANHEDCSGCCTCRLACALENHREVNPALAALRIEGRFPAPGDYRVHLCDQCGACADACPVAAIRADEKGVYRIDEDVCTGCMLCAEACPYQVIVVTPDTALAFKCNLCGACVAACPRDALSIASTRISGETL